MAVNLTNPSTIHAVGGVELGGLSAGIKKSGDLDLVIVALPESSSTAAVFTRNAYCAAPVTVAREQLASCNGAVRALLINSGGANAATGEPGLAAAREHCARVAEQLQLPADSVLPFSTGVIGEQLPTAKMLDGIDNLVSAGLSESAWLDAATGIMTTDTQPKLASTQLTLDGQAISISGFAKGSGMIQPNMATMLAYMFTDAEVAGSDLTALLQDVTERSFNSITVDGDTSTNDSFVLSATGSSGAKLSPASPHWQAFADAIQAVALQLAQALVRDGEGASKFITVNVTGGSSEAMCQRVGLTVGNSPLVKTAFFASDANLGRIVMAVGRSEVEGLQLDRLTLRIGDTSVIRQGQPDPDYTDALGQQEMAAEEIELHIDLGLGSASWTCWTCDLSHDYVSINADYRS